MTVILGVRAFGTQHVPPPVDVPGNPAQAIRAQHAAQGLAPDAETAKPGWLGERLDVRYVIEVLHPRARKN